MLIIFACFVLMVRKNLDGQTVFHTGIGEAQNSSDDSSVPGIHYLKNILLSGKHITKTLQNSSN